MSLFTNKDKLDYFKSNVQGLDEQTDFDQNSYYYNRDQATSQNDQQQLQNNYNLDNYGQQTAASQLQRQQLQQQALRSGSLVSQQDSLNYMNSANRGAGAGNNGFNGQQGLSGLGGIPLSNNNPGGSLLNNLNGSNNSNIGLTNPNLGSRVISNGNHANGAISNSSNSQHQQFDSTSFPSLSGGGNSSSLLGGGSTGRGYSAVAQLGASGLSRVGVDPDFVIENEDFPALPGASKGFSDSVVGGSSGQHDSKLIGGGMAGSSNGSGASQQNQGGANNMFNGSLGVDSHAGAADSIQQHGSSHPLLGGIANAQYGAGGTQTAVTKEQKFGLAGLLDVMRFTDKDINTLALGTDLTTFGLNLNSSDSLYPSFSSPFTDIAQAPDPQFSTPACYMMHPPSLKSEHLSKFQLETLFYMFYAMPKDILQACASQELYRREWRYHTELRVWLKARAPQELMQSHPNVQFVFFDSGAWEARLFTTPVRGNIAAGLLTEEEVRVKAPQANNSNSIPLGAVGPQ